MSVKTISKFLIILGLIVVFIAMWMDTTVRYGGMRVHNLSLAALQQNMLIIGGFGFMAGIILFALAKLKQSPKEESAERVETEVLIERATDIAGRASAVIERTSDAISSATQALLRKRDNIAGRIAVVLFVGICFLLLIEFLFYAAVTMIPITDLPNIEFLFYSAFTMTPIINLPSIAYASSFIFIFGVMALILYAFRAIPASRAIMHLLGANVIMFLVISLPISVIFFRFITDDASNANVKNNIETLFASRGIGHGVDMNLWMNEMAMRMAEDVAYKCFLPALISCVLIWVIRRSEKRKFRGPQ